MCRVVAPSLCMVLFECGCIFFCIVLFVYSSFFECSCFLLSVCFSLGLVVMSTPSIVFSSDLCLHATV